MSRAVVPSSIVFEVLDQHNYVDWSEALEAYLKARDLWDVVKFYQQPPKITAKKKFKAWEKKNAVALHAIKISCGTNMLHIIRGITEANEAWLCLKGCFIVPPSDSESQIFSGVQADEESVDNEHKKAYEDLDDAFSKRNFCAAIELCKKDLRLLIEKLPNNRLILNELITLGGLDHQEKVEEIMQLEQFDELLKYLSGKRYFSNRTPLEVAVCVGATEIAIRLIQMNSTLLFFPDTVGHIPLAVAIGSHLNKMANLLYLHTPNDFWTRENNVALTAGVITKSFEVKNLDIALKLLKSRPDEFILTKDFNGKTPLYAAASAPCLFRRTYHHPFLPEYICKVLGPRLPLSWMNFEISGMELLILLGNAIRDRTGTDDQTKTEIVSQAFFEAIKHENFNFILMLINSIKRIVYLTDDKSRNMYMLAVAHRHPKLFSLFFWNKQDQELKLDASVFKDKWGNNLLHMVGASIPRIALDRISKPALQMERELMWFEEIEKLVPDLIKKSRNLEGKTPHELFNESHKDLMMEAGKWMKESASSWAIVGPLIITIMFAAALQVPGGSLQDKGYPVFLGKGLFKLYMVLVAIALFAATISVWKFLEILSANYEERFLASLTTYNLITGTLFRSLATMLIAFCIGLLLTLHGELAIFLPIATIATCLVGLRLLADIWNLVTFVVFKIPFIKLGPSIFNRNIGHEVELIFKMLNRDSQQRR